ncbi:MAG TPA: HAMP domain-containing sensor histidine kinase [Streptosporangiaceae bacterium]|jgi:signal transduction histidine kinase|nr:HAMP domain-containing sensor histidine kinase [Streptosporangiaceae bacterium]
MARRITLSVIALVMVLLGVVVVPLGLHTASQDKEDFTSETMTTAVTIASVAEEHLDDHDPATALRQAVAELERHGDQVAVYGQDGRWVAGSRSITGAGRYQIGLALAGNSYTGHPQDDRLVVASPVLKDETQVSIGAVVLSRSTEPLEHRIATLWAWVTLMSLAGLVAAIVTATALARWVSRPLGGLEAAAQRLGRGEFDARAPATAGPPEVRRLTSNFNMMAGRLETLLSGHQAMIADVSHQLRTPLAALRLRLDVLALAAPAHAADELAGAQDEVVRLSRMVDGMLAVARAENVTSPAVAVPVNVVIAERAAAWRPAADEKPVTLETASSGPLWARLSEGHLEQVLDNLLANALEAVPAGGRVRVASAPAEGMVRVVVADDGPGMTPQQRRTALRRYVTATPGGTGLGLAIVHRLVTTDGGTIALSDTPEGGLTVTLDLPATGRGRASGRPDRRP